MTVLINSRLKASVKQNPALWESFKAKEAARIRRERRNLTEEQKAQYRDVVVLGIIHTNIALRYKPAFAATWQCWISMQETLVRSSAGAKR